MSCDISTGYYVNNTQSCVTDNRVIVSPGKSILFSPETPQGTVFSPTFSVYPGSAILIDAYNMPLDQPIYVNRVVKSTTAPITGDPCDPCAMNGAYGTSGVITFRERMTLGGKPNAWRLIKTAEPATQTLQLLVAVPGTYELELSDTNMLGDLEVEYAEWLINATPCLPFNYFAGIVTYNATVGA